MRKLVRFPQFTTASMEKVQYTNVQQSLEKMQLVRETDMNNHGSDIQSSKCKYQLQIA